MTHKNKKKIKEFYALKCCQFLVIKALGPYPDSDLYSAKMRDQDLDLINSVRNAVCQSAYYKILAIFKKLSQTNISSNLGAAKEWWQTNSSPPKKYKKKTSCNS